ncbi:MAG: 2OG-Fe(II) oxygenase [Ignavibacteriae bacterium]|nr:2OG-Fe(II) oxygenase [Ignavibacteria bacterium]MBI3363748.1 2OG-Fe(II) oxygenase [Ignavibacteriota bacterium]
MVVNNLGTVIEEIAGIISLPLFSPEECKLFVSEAENSNQWELAKVHGGHHDGDVRWVTNAEVRNAYVMGLSSLSSVSQQFDLRIKEYILPLIATKWKVHLREHAGAQILRYTPGGHYVAHIDSGTDLDDRHFSVVCYLNDDLTGGATSFPMINYATTPQCGKAIIFPSEYLHQAEQVISGRKYVIVTWIIGPVPVSWI